MIWIDIENDKFLVEKKYTFDLIFYTLGIDYDFYNKDAEISDDDIILYYSSVVKENLYNKYIWIKATNNLFNNKYLKEEPKYNVMINKLENNIKSISDIVSIFSDDKLLLERKENGTNIYVDIISDIFFMATRYEEVISDDKDNHNRFLLENSLAYKYNFLNRPIVNEQMEMLLVELKNLSNNIHKKIRWKDKDFIFFLSHDIDSILKYRDKFIRMMGIKILKEKSIKQVFNYLNNSIKSIINKESDPFWKFNYLANLEKSYKIAASYYFMTGGETSLDNYYNINNKILRDIFKKIKSNSSEIGIHGSYNSYNNEKLLKNEILKLEKYSTVSGIRQHYLRFKAPDTWELQSNCNLAYDTTLGYAKHGGFRAGICTPYKPFNILNRKVIEIWEIPLIVMDGTIAESQYMNLEPKEALKFVIELIERVRDVNGVFSLLWHNSHLSKNSEWKEWIKVYEEILRYSYENNSFALSGKEIIKLYEK